MATATVGDPLTLPAVSLKLGLSLDLVRKHFARVPELAALARKAGTAKFVEASDLPRVKELLEAAGMKPAVSSA